MDSAFEQLGLSGWALVATLAAALFVVAFKGIESTSRYKKSPKAQDFIVMVKFVGSFVFASAGLSAAIALAAANPWLGIFIFVGILAVIIYIVYRVDKLAQKDEAEIASQAAASLATDTPSPTTAQAPPAAANTATVTGVPVP